MARIVVAMSGGVDSSVVAALLHDQGHDVIGVTLNVWPDIAPDAEARSRTCCGVSAVEDARRVATSLGIPYYVLNFKELFRKYVISDFVNEYKRGRTPNPCVRCNQHVKFRPVLDRAVALGADFVATGHYARRDVDPHTGRFRLRKAVDQRKDQSYVLYPMQQDELARTLFPLGDLTKEETRRLAVRYGLAVAEKPESMEICFVPDNRYGAYIEKEAPDAHLPGPIIDTHGRYRGEHNGIVHFTIGQRRGLGIATGEPLFVVGIDAENRTVIVGSDDELFQNECLADGLNLVGLSQLTEPIRCRARVRHRMIESEATVSPAPHISGDTVQVRFDHPIRALTPGQAIVFYNDDLVLGGATIATIIATSTGQATAELAHA